MIILLPITTEQTISVMPRDTTNTVTSINLRRDGDGRSETITSVTVVANGNFTNYSFSSTILEEGSTYYMEVTGDGDLIYRDKIYSTTQTNYTVKHEVAQDRYTQRTAEVNDNTYII